ncbi:hypothetical protein SDC9_167738 [bioreactor metagenome]|uniref:Uncharacterized protein n=1 Tax=bioreactor metagenome TaxID=1076179 RepID=A0A645G372_9ZZZZ
MPVQGTGILVLRKSGIGYRAVLPGKQVCQKIKRFCRSVGNQHVFRRQVVVLSNLVCERARIWIGIITDQVQATRQMRHNLNRSIPVRDV